MRSVSMRPPAIHESGHFYFAQTGHSHFAATITSSADDNPPRFRYLTHSMNTPYNRLAGHSVERLAALSDGIFAVAMTLLAIDLRLPAAEIIHSDRDLFHALLGFAPNVLVYFMSFLTLGIFWVGQQAQLNHLKRSNVRLTWITDCSFFLL